MPKVIRRTKSSRGAERTCGRPGCGRAIRPGEDYLQWSFRYGGTRYRCAEHPPRPSELTQSLMSDVYAAVEDCEDHLPGAGTAEEVRELVEQVAEAAREVAAQYAEAAEPFGGGGDNAERADEVEAWADEVATFYPDDGDIEAIRDEARAIIGEAP